MGIADAAADTLAFFNSRVRRILGLEKDHILAENRLPGSAAWVIGSATKTKSADDLQMQIKGYASATSVNLGETIDFHVTVGTGESFNVSIYRLGHYDGVGARHLLTSPDLPGVAQSEPNLDTATGLISCDWPSAWRLKIPKTWTSGYYLAVFTTTGGWRNYAPFVVTDRRRRAELCVVIPFTTYLAYNQWPYDKVRGKNFYYGFDGEGNNNHEHRALKASFDRPYARNGMPSRVDLDHYFLRWAEASGYDLTYVSSVDLHNGSIDLSKYSGIVFSGHDEYWSRPMRDAAETVLGTGTSLAFLSANNVYWHVRLEDSASGGKDRVVVCYKSTTDPDAGEDNGTRQWRANKPNPANPEQALLGVQYNGIIAEPVPLVVQAADHWVWAGTELKNGDLIPAIVSGEADGIFPEKPRPQGVQQTILSSSPYRLKSGVELVQNSSIYETAQGAIVFAAASLNWPHGLGHPGVEDARIRQATANVLDRMRRRRN